MNLYFKYFLIHIKSQMQYKASFFMTAIGQFLTSFGALLGIYFLMIRFNRVEGFTLDEVLLCFSIVLMAYSIVECFGRGLDLFPNLIRSGEFDRIMVRPRNTVFQVIASKMDFTKIGRLLQAVMVLSYVIVKGKIIWNYKRVITLILMIGSGACIFFGLFLIYAALSFFTIEGLEFMNIFTDGGREFASYPLSIYGKGILKFFTYVIPFALFQYYPFLFLIGRSDNTIYMCYPILALLFLMPCYII
ncbi:MAG: hypothetical protein GX974_06475 [Clostridiales bacterium]|nr:hypothetical protein [Clostridiales bacterium]